MWRGVLAAVLACFILGGSPQQQSNPTSQQKAKAAENPPPVKQQPSAASSQQTGCPGTSFANMSCEAVTAEADAEQASAARQNNWLGVVTALAAGLAAWFAKGAVDAARASLSLDKKRTDWELRSWIAYDGVNISPFVNGFIDDEPESHGLICSIGIRNVGPLPAINLTVYTSRAVVPSDDPTPIFKQTVDEGRAGSLGPSMVARGENNAVRAHELDQIKERTANLWLYLYARYQRPSDPDTFFETEITLRTEYGGEYHSPDGKVMSHLSARAEGPQNRMT